MKNVIVSIMAAMVMVIAATETNAGITTNTSWQLQQVQKSRIERQFAGLGAGISLYNLDNGIKVAPVISGNLAFLWADYYVNSGGSVFLGGRAKIGTNGEFVPLAIGATIWHNTPLWASELDRLYDISVKIGFTVRCLRFVEIGVFVHSSIPDPKEMWGLLKDEGETFFSETTNSASEYMGYSYNSIDDGINPKDILMDAIMPRVTIVIRGVGDL